jgi:adenylate cyclase
VHVGFHSGPVIQVEKDVLGDTVKLASKLVEQAQKGQTITSQQTAALLSPALQPLSRQLRSVPLGGARQGMRLCEIVPLTQAQDHAITRVRLTFRNYIIDCSRERSSILIGRDYRCGLVISDQTASRKHCSIELRGDQFVVQDHSTNGTYVTVEHEKAILLKGGNLPLRRYVGQRESATTSPWSEIAIAYRVIGVQCFSFETSSSA